MVAPPSDVVAAINNRKRKWCSYFNAHKIHRDTHGEQSVESLVDEDVEYMIMRDDLLSLETDTSLQRERGGRIHWLHYFRKGVDTSDILYAMVAGLSKPIVEVSPTEVEAVYEYQLGIFTRPILNWKGMEPEWTYDRHLVSVSGLLCEKWIEKVDENGERQWYLKKLSAMREAWEEAVAEPTPKAGTAGVGASSAEIVKMIETAKAAYFQAAVVGTTREIVKILSQVMDRLEAKIVRLEAEFTQLEMDESASDDPVSDDQKSEDGGAKIEEAEDGMDDDGRNDEGK
ncbi:hypothetical protein QBC44DRAFT_311016 [Cladorrhinum sp. PSN332]|nr:hypothetical protein QBC44DRAFT_311016 [Cladorrhinum sp. PSN332]